MTGNLPRHCWNVSPERDGKAADGHRYCGSGVSVVAQRNDVNTGPDFNRHHRFRERVGFLPDAAEPPEVPPAWKNAGAGVPTGNSQVIVDRDPDGMAPAWLPSQNRSA